MRAGRIIIVAYMLLLPVQGVFAAGFLLHSISTELSDGVYALNARVDLDLGEEMSAALKNGVPIVFVLDLQITEPRYRWFKKAVIELEQRYELRYHALSQQYLLTNLNTGIQTIFRSLSRALEKLGRIENLPLLDASLLTDREVNHARLRFRVDVSELPLPLKIRAYTSGKWQTSSQWIRLDLS